jgi:hypothetical protein
LSDGSSSNLNGSTSNSDQPTRLKSASNTHLSIPPYATPIESNQGRSICVLAGWSPGNCSATDVVTLRGGYYYDPTPQPQKVMSPLLADADRHGLSLGVGYAPNPWSLDFFLLFPLAGDRDTGGVNLDGYEGTYRPSGTVLGVNFGYQF